ncbi:SLAC1 family transporter [Corynebacterium sp. 335C]
MNEQNDPRPGDAAPEAAGAPGADSPAAAGPVAKHSLADRLRATPLPLFAVVMGTAGLSTAWRRAELTLGVPGVIATILFVGAAVAYVGLLAAYAFRAATARGSFRADAVHPVKATFLSSTTISLLLLAGAGLPVLPVPVTQAMWWIGAVGHLVLMLVTLRIWMRPDIVLKHVTPAWFIPVVGNIVTPIAGVPLGHTSFSMFSFSTGLVLWLGLLPIVLFRLFLHDHRLPAPMAPTALVLVAPPAVGSMSAAQMFGVPPSGDGLLAWGLFCAAGAFLLLCLTTLPEISAAPFGIPHWAMSFPLAAYASATLFFEPTLGVIILAFASIVIAWLWAKTVAAIVKGGIFAPEPAPAAAPAAAPAPGD